MSRLCLFSFIPSHLGFFYLGKNRSFINNERQNQGIVPPPSTKPINYNNKNPMWGSLLLISAFICPGYTSLCSLLSLFYSVLFFCRGRSYHCSGLIQLSTARFYYTCELFHQQPIKQICFH